MASNSRPDKLLRIVLRCLPSPNSPRREPLPKLNSASEAPARVFASLAFLQEVCQRTPVKTR